MKRILISRTDSIGDVVLTLPMCGIIKKRLPGSEIIFLGRSYTQDVVLSCKHVDHFVDYAELSQLSCNEQIDMIRQLKIDAVLHVFPNSQISRLMAKAGIGLRIGASGRLYHYRDCNKIIRLSRRRSALHEAQLNTILLKGTGIDESFSLQQLVDFYGFEPKGHLLAGLSGKIDPKRFKLILHPRSKGSAREWGLDNFSRLISLLPASEYQVFISGTADEGRLLKNWMKTLPAHVVDMTGQMSLQEFLLFIGQTDGLVAASTGPLHLAAAIGKIAIGIYPPIQPMHPGRWAPLGKHATFLVKNANCSDCRKTAQCHCMQEISAEAVFEKLIHLRNEGN
jgi:ADP-heptose:LPS heptosyltransferase